jgi:hypothetical protein
MLFMDSDVPHGGDFQRFDYAKGREDTDPWEIRLPLQDDRVPDSDKSPVPGVDTGDLTDYEKLVIIGDLIKEDRGQIGDIGIPLYQEIPGDIMPPKAPSGDEIQARANFYSHHLHPQLIITPGEGIDSKRGFLGDLRAAVNQEVHSVGDIQA